MEAVYRIFKPVCNDLFYEFIFLPIVFPENLGILFRFARGPYHVVLRIVVISDSVFTVIFVEKNIIFICAIFDI